MVEDIVLCSFPKEAGVYLFKANDEVIYVGSSNNLYKRMVNHRIYIKQCSKDGHQQDLYKFLQSNHFAVELQITGDYRQLEQKLIEQYNPKYNSRRANTGCGAFKGREAEYNKQYYESNKQQKKQYRESHKQQVKQYQNQLCLYDGQTMTLNALSIRFTRMGIPYPVIEAKKYMIGGSND